MDEEEPKAEHAEDTAGPSPEGAMEEPFNEPSQSPRNTPPTPPNSLDPSSGPAERAQDTKQIMQESLALIKHHLQQINQQKHFLASMAFLLDSIEDTLGEYKEHVEKLNKYLVNNDNLQSQWICTYSRSLPSYSQYCLVVKDTPEKIKVDLIPFPVEQGALKQLVEEVTHALYAAGLEARAQRSLGLMVNSKMDARSEVTEDDYLPFHMWLMMLGTELGNEELLEDKFFEVSSNVDFLDWNIKGKD